MRIIIFIFSSLRADAEITDEFTTIIFLLNDVADI